MTQKIEDEWLNFPPLQELLKLLNEGEGEARIAGGAVRNALLGQEIADVDVATTLVPRDVILRMKAAGHKTVPTGIEHGTVTVVVDGSAYEVTTLREDIETDGRHAKVIYGTDWKADAMRRDLTMNALYLEADGTVFDPLDGLPDVLSQTVRFIGEAEQRIQEDYLRILRFFRFFAWYGKFRPDADGLRACARLKHGLDNLSVERIWHELIKTLAAPDPGRAVLWMRQTGVLTSVLPEGEKWGIDALPGLLDAERNHGWQADSLVRLMSILPPQVDRLEAMSKRLKLPNRVKSRLVNWASTPVPDAGLKQDAFLEFAYWQDETGLSDRLRLAIGVNDENSKKFVRQLKWLARWKRPTFPLKGGNLIEKGMTPGPHVAETLLTSEKAWVASGFSATKEELLDSVVAIPT